MRGTRATVERTKAPGFTGPPTKLVAYLKSHPGGSAHRVSSPVDGSGLLIGVPAPGTTVGAGGLAKSTAAAPAKVALPAVIGTATLEEPYQDLLLVSAYAGNRIFIGSGGSVVSRNVLVGLGLHG